MTILVTGADGFIGSHLTEELVKKGEKVKALVYYNSFNSWGWLDTLPKEIIEEIEVVSGDILNIGNPNCRVKIKQPIHEFFNDWCQHGPSHHLALGTGDHADAIEAFAESMKFKTVRL